MARGGSTRIDTGKFQGWEGDAASSSKPWMAESRAAPQTAVDGEVRRRLAMKRERLR